MSLKVKLISTISAFILVLSMLLIGVFAATGNFTINLKGNVQFNIEDSTLYIKDIRLSDGLTTGETIDNFLPGFAKESFELDFGTISSDSGTIVIEIDVVNTTSTTYNASSQSSLSNATLSVSGIIEGTSVLLDEVATYDDISGTIYISVQVAVSTNITLDNIVIDLEEQKGYLATITNSSSYTLYAMGDDGEIRTVSNGVNIEINTTSISFAYTSGALQGLSLYVDEPGGVVTVDPGVGEAIIIRLSFNSMLFGLGDKGGWSTTNEDENFTISEGRKVLSISLTEDTEFNFY